MKFTALTAIISLATTVVSFYALIFPGWFQQSYKENSPTIVTQGFGIWAFHSSGEQTSPFYASDTTLQYTTLCSIGSDGNVENFPNWMLGVGPQYQEALCNTQMTILQLILVTGCFFSFTSLCCSLIATCKSFPGRAEKFINWITLLTSVLFSAGLILWGWGIQSKLYEIDPINGAYSTCKSTSDDWQCWFYGTSFWMMGGAALGASLTGYVSSYGRREKMQQIQKDAALRAIAEEEVASRRSEADAVISDYNSHEDHNDNHHHSALNNNNSPVLISDAVPDSRAISSIPENDDDDASESISIDVQEPSTLSPISSTT